MNYPFFLLVLALVFQAAAAQAPLSFNLTSVTNSLNKLSHPLKQSEDLYFVVEVDIGLPPARTLLAVDTVLPLSWVAGQFDATKSSTFTPMRARDPHCLPLLARNSSSNKCTYDVVSSRGQFGLDIFMNFLSSKRVPFGAGKFVDDVVGTVDGRGARPGRGPPSEFSATTETTHSREVLVLSSL